MNAFVQNFLNIHVLYESRMLLLFGLETTLKLAVVSLCLVTVLGLILAVLRQTRSRLIRGIIALYVNLSRSIPAIVVFLLFYFMLPYFSVSPSRFVSAVLALVFNGGGFFEEVFRSGIESIDKGQSEAARSLGLTFWQSMRHVILPQTLQVVLPPFTSNSLALTQTTVLASVIALPEIMRQAQHAYGLFANPTPLIAAAVTFFIILWPLVRFTSYLERRYAKQ